MIDMIDVTKITNSVSLEAGIIAWQIRSETKQPYPSESWMFHPSPSVWTKAKTIEIPQTKLVRIHGLDQSLGIQLFEYPLIPPFYPSA